MAGANKNYVLGKGRFFFEPFLPGASSGAGEKYVAQTKEGSFTVSADTLDHYDADEGLNVLDDQLTTKVDVAGKFAAENITLDVMADFLLANGITSTTITSGTGVTSAFTDVQLGRYLQLGKTATMPQGARNITNPSIVVNGAGGPLANVDNVNYTVDLALARVYLQPGATGIAAGDDLVVTFDQSADVRETVISKDQQLRGALRFISANPTGGQRDYYFPLVNLSPDGDFNLKGSDWQSVSFKFTALKLNALTERVYIDGRAA